MTYDYKKTLIKGAKLLVIYGFPWTVTLFINNFPDIANLPIGMALHILVDFLKHKVGVRLP